MRARKVDANLTEIVKLARKVGFLINIRNDDLGDLDAQRGRRNEIWEVKVQKGRFTAKQKKNREAGWIIWTVRTEADVLSARARFV